MPYELLKNDNTIDKGYLLSTRDLCGIDYLPRLIKAGVKCFKIEGRLKNPEYVATVTKIYRKYIDICLNNQDFKVDNLDKKDLMQVFNRGGFSTGHFENEPNKDLIFKEKQNHMGIYLGKVIEFLPKKGHIKLKLEGNLQIGDSIQLEKESNYYTVSELMIKNSNLKSASTGQIVEIGRMKGNISAGDKIYKTNSKALIDNCKITYSSNKEFKKIPINCSISIKNNQPICISINTINTYESLYNDINFTIETDIIPVVATSMPITEEKVKAQISKTGDTPYTFTNINVDLDDNLYIPSMNSLLNELRRSAIAKLQELCKKRYKKQINKLELLQLHKNITSNSSISLLLNILDEDYNYSELCNGVDNVYIPLKFFFDKNYHNTINNITAKFKTYIYLPTIIRNNYKKLIDLHLNNIINNFNIKGFVISNLGQIELVKKYNLELIGNYTLNIFNTYSSNFLSNYNFSKLTISPELSKDELISLSNNVNSEIIVYGNLPVMNINYCLLQSTNHCIESCNKICSNNKYYLKDRLNYKFILLPDNIDTVTTIYNSKITSILPTDFNSSYRIDILNESIDEINKIIETVKNGLRFEGNNYTNGNLNKLV